ncbi:hypothetical protein TVAG_476740 [Trichomonas vaginalis G3]|uniref:Uncharacterized protein n=1 Tax=Trichomonas vaginalis (strain ATCC PRA-98 / G3) TaxID=412133 RepID=A2DA97_TRIV3|nr:hypothetical protein TVAGG3_0266780 [Trichomonas vaginalis G3]EAY22745.1 hypothetical protein TVAG_476740 [Trichomonas vaginalis G3]KAI5525556.1 hypothetical protein TVAGG3_0266780 [Trichomonas vaginalis G3]|eukprot:XP_001583731.1 hypothetical protein [Trichomonas vaginalis G3]
MQSFIEKYDDELTQNLTTCLEANESAEKNIMECKDLLFVQPPSTDQIRTKYFDTVRKECAAEMKQLFETLEKGSDMKAAHTIEYYISGYDLYDQDEQAVIMQC